MNINNILVPTDFSDNAMKAAKLAAKIATETNANIMLINGYVKPQGGTSVMVKITDLIAKEAKENMSDFLNSLKEEFPNVNFDGKTSYGYIDEVIQVITQDQPYDLIIMGTTGSDKIQNKVFGSNTSKMIQKSAVPVLSVPSDFSGHELETMVLCVELPLKNKEVLHRFNAISAALGVETKIISMPLKKSVESLQDEIDSIKAETNIPVEIVRVKGKN